MGVASEVYVSKLQYVQSLLEASAGRAGLSSPVFSRLLSCAQAPDAAATPNVTALSFSALPYASAASSSSSAWSTPLKATASSGETVYLDGTPDTYRAFIEEASAQYGLDPDLIRAVIQAESSFRTDLVSSAGAQGLMQLMPQYMGGYGVTDAFDPRQNIMGGAAELADYLNQFGDLRVALAAYNAGPTRVRSYHITDADDPAQYGQISSGVRAYVSRVLTYYDAFRSL